MRGVAADITSLSSVDTLLTALHDHFSGVQPSILVLNASHNARPRVGSASEDDITDSLTGNLHWPIMLMENLVRQGWFAWNSRVVVISSDRVRDPSPGSGLFKRNARGYGIASEILGDRVAAQLSWHNSKCRVCWADGHPWTARLSC